jgi:hypothetical protein
MDGNKPQLIIMIEMKKKTDEIHTKKKVEKHINQIV